MMMNIRDKFDYINGVHKVPFDSCLAAKNIETDVFVKSKDLSTIQKFDIKTADVKLSIIAIEQTGWVFIYNSKSELWKLFKEIVNGGEIVEHLSKVQNEYNTERIVWKILLLRAFGALDAYHRDFQRKFNIQDDMFRCFSYTKAEFFCENIDFDEYYRCFQMLLPENLENARNETTQIEYQNLVQKYGSQFENAQEILDTFKDSISEKTLEKDTQENINDVKHWRDALDKQIVDSEWIQQYLTLLMSERKMLEKAYFQMSAEKLRKRHGDISEKKVSLLSQLNKLQFEDALEMYRDYQAAFRNLQQEEKNAPFHDDNSLIHSYINYYHYGSTLLSDHLNRINKYKNKRQSIPQEELDAAMMYFYETDTPEAAEQLREKDEYLDNKKNGVIGEKEVEYALKWLDSSYVRIPKTSEGKYGEKCIVLYNPDFIDEAQEYDHIIIGKQGVFLIETKNYAGKLIVDKYGNWRRIKKDGVEEGERNPIQQLRRHEKLLRSIIGEDIPIISIICMAHPKMIIEGVENCSVPLVKSDLLVEYIENYGGKRPVLKEKAIIECKNKIEEYMK